MAPTQWAFPAPLPAEAAQAFPGFDRAAIQILLGRGLRTLEAAERFLAPAADAPGDPFELLGMRAAVDRLERARRRGERVAIYGDYDVDGVTATALLLLALRQAGVEVSPYIPNRFEEGYGLNSPALESLGRSGVGLVISVDCGIRSVEEVEAARAVGLDVIITDHHQPGVQLPPAAAVINPRQRGDDYGFKDLSGVGIAYQLAAALSQAWGGAGPDDLIDLVALGTVADLAPMLGENRWLVSRGLARMRQAARPGLDALFQAARITPRRLNASAVGYSVAPRLNAAGRLESAQRALRLLLAHDPLEAIPLAADLERMNRERQLLTRETVDRARQMILEDAEGQLLLFATADDFNEGVIGLAAARLVEEFHRPAIVATRTEGIVRASARSIAEFHITHALDQCADLLLRYGGHAAAAGFTVRDESAAALRARLRSLAAEAFGSDPPMRRLRIDAVVAGPELNLSLMRFLDRLEPCGPGNPRPLLAVTAAEVMSARRVGPQAEHLKLLVRSQGRPVEAIAFRQGERQAEAAGSIEIAFHLERNEYQGLETLQMNIVEFRAAGGRAERRAG
jgi:single-stranded-DNA-specific exonuclease